MARYSLRSTADWKIALADSAKIANFLNGSSSEGGYNGINFATANNVVLVTINYRGIIFGFMSLAAIDKNFEDSGYLGTKDQIAALQWVKENISGFGGNPDNITVFGESAGSI